ncbi:MAG: hypothetical protein AUI14_08745 [Actinobacteria bacterium 13_2_20CM_2_71_6]|nr:MAG: hypothetical protein AUI14_08745 [Actinobacteria bacterium 13_2_20CM_2_71_6]
MTSTPLRTDPAIGCRPASEWRQILAVAAALIGFSLNFWAWVLLVPLEPDFQARFGLGATGQALLLAVPLVVGSVARLPVGVLSDRYGPRVMLPAVTLATAAAVAALADEDSLAVLIAAGVLLGVAGTASAAGAPLIGRWYQRRRRGLAFGLFGASLAGAAVSGVTSQLLYDAVGRRTCLLTLAGLLAGYAVLAAFLIGGTPVVRAQASLARATLDVLRTPETRRIAILYSVAFGGLAALALYLPAYLNQEYHLSWQAALVRTGAVIALAAVAHIVGGWFADRTNPARTLVICYAGAACCALVQAFQAGLDPVGILAIAGVGVFLGAASGTLTGLVANVTPPQQIGTAMGAVGVAGGLGGVLPPLLLGSVYDLQGSYAIGLTVLAGAGLAAAVYARDRRPLDRAPQAGPPVPLTRRIDALSAVVAVSAIPTGGDGPGDVLSALAVVAINYRLVIVYGWRTAPTATCHRTGSSTGFARSCPGTSSSRWCTARTARTTSSTTSPPTC